MAKITKKSVNTLMSIYENSVGDTVLKLTNPENEDSVVMEIDVKTSLEISEKGMFVDRVVNSCFDSDGDFMPQYLEPVFAITLLQMTTNVPVFEDTVTLTNEDGTEVKEKGSIVNIEKTFDLCKAINLAKNVTDANYQALVGELKQMVTDKLEYMKEINVRKASNSLQMLIPLLDSVQKIVDDGTASEFLDKLSDLNKIKLEQNNGVE